MSYNPGDMTLVKCAFHSTGRATEVCAEAMDRSVMDAVAVVAGAVAAAPERFCGLVDVLFVGVVAGLVTVIVVAGKEFQYLQVERRFFFD
jgi:hypothetical protein